MSSRQDLGLPVWGPYSKHYAGISKILGGPMSTMVDFSFVIGRIRNKVIVPDVNIESGYHHWDATADLRHVSFRYEIQWKDVEYADVEFFAHDENSHLAKVTFHNNSPFPKEYVAALFACLRQQRNVVTSFAPGETWIGAETYAGLSYVVPHDEVKPDDGYEFKPLSRSLEHGKDGLRKGVVIGDLLVDGQGLGNLVTPYPRRFNTLRRGNPTFLLTPGTTVHYQAGAARPFAGFYLRCAMFGVRRLLLEVLTPNQRTEAVLTGNTADSFIDFADLQMVKVALPQPEPLQAIDLRVKAIELLGNVQSFVFDGMLLSDADEETAASRFDLHAPPPRFDIHRQPGQKGVTFTTAAHPATIGLYSEDERPVPPAPYNDCTIPSVLHSEMAGAQVMRRLNNDSLTNWYKDNIVIWGDNQGHFAGYSVSPIVVPPHSRSAVHVALACGDLADGARAARAVYDQRLAIEKKALAHLQKANPAFSDTPFRFSQERLMAQLYTNVIYPQPFGRGQMVKTYVPGKRFATFFTWDSGMHGLGLTEYSPERALDIVNQAMSFEDEPDVLGTINGALLPLHIYLLNEIYQTTHDRQMLAAYYPRARKYLSFFNGQSPLSRLDMFKSGLLNAYVEGDNLLGIDDYPLQHHVRQMGLQGRVSAAGTTAHAIRASKIVQLFAHELGLKDDSAELQTWIIYLANALQSYSWDDSCGYYSHVLDQGKQTVYYDEKTNFNMGLDGVSPLVAAICTPEQQRRLIAHLMTPGELWTPYGITAVAQNAPYYRPDGYWVGKVWIPHQWFMWKALIGAGEMALAERIAQTALRVWKNATDETYNLWETFDNRTGQGEGAHQFAGLSAPVAAFYHRYYTPGRVTGGYDTLLHRCTFSAGRNQMTIVASAPFHPGPTGLLIVMRQPGRYCATAGSQACEVIAPDGWLNLVVRLAATGSEISISPA